MAPLATPMFLSLSSFNEFYHAKVIDNVANTLSACADQPLPTK